MPSHLELMEVQTSKTDFSCNFAELFKVTQGRIRLFNLHSEGPWACFNALLSLS